MANLSLIRSIAKERKITLKTLATQVGLTEQGLHKILRDNTTTITTIERIAQVLEVSPIVFFDERPAGSAHAYGKNAMALAGDGNEVSVPNSLLDMLEEKDARIKELTDMLLKMNK